jgi:uncharacterized protein
MRADVIDLAGLRLSPGEGRRLDADVAIAPLTLGSETYAALAERVPVRLDVSRMLGGGYALHLAFTASASGPCMRCLGEASPDVAVEAREVTAPSLGTPSVSRSGGGDDAELESPYVEDERLDLAAWAHDAFALALPAKILCSEDCRGLCPECAANLNEAGPEHAHAAAPDPRWAPLRELRLE